MSEALERMRRIEDEIRELANDLDWLDKPVGFYGDEGDQGERDVHAKGRPDG